MSQHRKNLLSGTSTVVLMSLLGASAALADTTVTLPTRDGMTANITAAQPNLAVSPNSGVVSGTVNGALVTNSGTATGTGTGTNTVSTNLIGASAADVTQFLAVDLSKATTVAADGNSPSGIGILGVAPNAGQAISSVTASQIANTISATNPVATQDGNTIQAVTTLNQTGTYTAGTLPTNPTFSSALNGTVNFNTTPAEGTNALTATGGVVGASAQTNTAAAGAAAAGGAAAVAPSSATLTNDVIALTVTNGTASATSNGSLTTNSLLAQYAGNSADNAISVMNLAGTGSNGALQLNAPLVVANTQQDSSANNAGLGAFVTGSNVTATVNGPAATSGTLNVTSNKISASVVGNDASGTSTLQDGTLTPAGNAVLVADGVTVNGIAAAGQRQNVITGGTGANPTAALTGDLGAFNAQQNLTAQTLNATATNDSVSATVGSVQGSVTEGLNSITAQGIGNRASNTVAAGGSTTGSIDAQVSVANLQANANLTLTAANGGNSVTVSTAIDPGSPGTPGEPGGEGATPGVAAQTLGTSALTLAGNQITSRAFGNTVGNTVTLQASQLGNDVAAGVLTSDRTNDASSAAAGFTINSVQSNGGSVTALTQPNDANESTVNPTISLTAGNANSAVGAATLTVDGNALLATGVANDASSVMTLTGSTLTGSAGILGQQTATSPVTATLNGGTVSLTAAGSSFTNTTLGATNNVEQALGYANNAVNTLAANPVNGYTATGAAAVTTAALATTPTVSAALSVLNDQSLTAAGGEAANPNVTASAYGNVLLSARGGDAVGATLNATGNTLNGEAHGNAATNTLNLGSASGVAGSIGNQAAGGAVAAIGNVQTVAGSTIEGIAEGSGREGEDGENNTVTVLAGNLAGASTLNASSNAQTATAIGSSATNTLAANASSLALGGGSAAGGATPNSATAALAVASSQTSSNGERYAYAEDGGVLVQVGDVNGSTIHADSNSNKANARDNTVANALSTTGSVSFVATGNGVVPAVSAIGNAQTSTGVAVYAESYPYVASYVVAGNLTDTTLTTSSNTVATQALGNTAGNTLTASGSSLGLGGGGTAGGATQTGANAAFAIASSQASNGGYRDAESYYYNAYSSIGDASGSTIHLDNNSILATARDNTAVNALTTTGTVSFTAAAGAVPAVSAISNQQTSSADAEAYGSDGGTVAGLSGGTLTNSTVSLTSNAQTTTAVGNLAENTLSATGGSVSLSGGIAAGGATPTAATAAFAIANNQSTTAGYREAETYYGGGVYADFGDASGSTITVTGSSVTATARDNTAVNALTTAGTVSFAAAGAGNVPAVSAIGNQQTSANAYVYAAAYPEYGTAYVTGEALTNTSVVSASSNTLSAYASGNDAANTLTSTGSSVGLSGSATAGGATGAGATAAFAIANNQSTTGGYREAYTDYYGNTSVDVGDVQGTSVVHADGNSTTATARDNTVANVLSTTGTVSYTASGTGSVPAVSAIGSVQSSSGVEVTAYNDPDYHVSVTTGALGGATLTASSNVQASAALGNDATNSLTVAGSSLTATGTGAFGSAQEAGAAAAFAVANTQSSSNGGTREANTYAGGVSVAFGGKGGDNTGATNSTVNVNANSFTATASDNTAANNLAMNGGPGATGALQRVSSLTGTGVLQNTQTSTASVTANTGYSEGAIGVTVMPSGAISGTPLRVDATVLQATAQGNRASNTVTVLADTITGAANLAAGSQGAQDQTVTTQTSDADLYYDANQRAYNANRTRSVAVPSGAGNDNAYAGTVGGTDPTTTGSRGAAGDLALGNVQSVSGDLASSSYGQVSISNPTSLTGSPVSITNTAAGATTQGNTAANAMSLAVSSTGTSAPGLAVFSAQTGSSTTLASTSSLALTVPGTTDITVTGNTNVALASLNDATNTLTVQADNSFGSAYGARGGSASSSNQQTQTTQDVPVTRTVPYNQTNGGVTYSAPNATASGTQTTTTTQSPGGGAIADLTLFNEQSATNGTAITANAVTTIGQNGSTITGTGVNTVTTAPNVGLDTTAILTASNNVTMARAQANGATNTITGTATNSFAASEALLNVQTSNSGVTAQSVNSTTDNPNAPLASMTFSGAAVAVSTADLIGNAAQAMARGNVATNAATGSSGNSATGNISVASLQSNDGAITANGGMVLNYSLVGSGALTGTGAVNTATVNMTGNSSTALAMGNAASNAVTGTTGNTYGASTQLAKAVANGGITGTTGSGYAGYAPTTNATANAAQAQYAALNLQSNTAAINATNTSTMTVNATGVNGLLNGTVSGNAIGAAAYANYANNTISMSGGTTGATTGSLTSYQRNTGNVTATVSGSVIGLTGGAAGTGTLGVTNNAISASATGNSVTNVIGTLPTAR